MDENSTEINREDQKDRFVCFTLLLLLHNNSLLQA